MGGKKRTAAELTGVQPPALKRRKASNISVTSATSAHPLRQTSFPPESRGESYRSPSVDTMSIVSGSQVSGTDPPKKKRGRKAKNADAGSKEPTPSLVGGRAPTVVSTNAGDNGNTAAEEEEDKSGPRALELVDSTARTQEQKKEEIKLRAFLVEAFDPEQMARYECWRASKLSDAVVKRVCLPVVTYRVDPANRSNHRSSMRQSRSRYQQTSC